MDPYLEAPDIWPDFHDRLAGQISANLNRVLPAPYYARLEMRPEIGILEAGGYSRRIVPDVAVAEHASGKGEPRRVAVLDAPRTTISPSIEWTVHSEPLHHAFIEIRDPTQGHRLVTLIEIASPSNKRQGVDRRAYVQKQREVLDSDATLIELDLLRDGERLLPERMIEECISRLEPKPDYLAMVNRAWKRLEGAVGYQVFPIPIEQPLPCIPVPLRQDLELPLDLQFIFNDVYDNGPYRRGAVDYSRDPSPPLDPQRALWAGQLLQTARLR
jgi:hypothetical protein